MRTRLTITGILAASLLAAGVMATTPAHAASSANTVYVSTGSANRYIRGCATASSCNEVTAGALDVQFARTGTLAWVDGQPALGVYYKIINGTAVDGTDFNTPVTGEAIIPAGQWVGNALVIPLVNEGQFGTSKSFTVEITGTTSPITISPGTATATILGGTVPPDCSFTWISGSSQSMSCTERPATQVWNIQASCKSDMGPNLPEPGNQVTGDGTSTISSDCSDLFGGTFQIDSASSRGPQPVRAAGARAGCPPSAERWQAGLNRYGHNRKIRALMHCRSHPAGSGFVTIPRQNLMARPQTPPGALRGPGAGAHGCFARMSRRHRAGGAP